MVVLSYTLPIIIIIIIIIIIGLCARPVDGFCVACQGLILYLLSLM